MKQQLAPCDQTCRPAGALPSESPCADVNSVDQRCGPCTPCRPAGALCQTIVASVNYVDQQLASAGALSEAIVASASSADPQFDTCFQSCLWAGARAVMPQEHSLTPGTLAIDTKVTAKSRVSIAARPLRLRYLETAAPAWGRRVNRSLPGLPMVGLPSGALPINTAMCPAAFAKPAALDVALLYCSAKGVPPRKRSQQGCKSKCRLYPDPDAQNCDSSWKGVSPPRAKSKPAGNQTWEGGNSLGGVNPRPGCGSASEAKGRPISFPRSRSGSC